MPLNLEANPAAESWDIQGAMGEALKVIMAITRVGTLGLLCDDPNVTMEDVPELMRSDAEYERSDGHA